MILYSELNRKGKNQSFERGKTECRERMASILRMACFRCSLNIKELIPSIQLVTMLSKCLMYTSGQYMYALLTGKSTSEFLPKISDGKAKWKDSLARLTFLYSLFQRSGMWYDLSPPTCTQYASLLFTCNFLLYWFWSDPDRPDQDSVR